MINSIIGGDVLIRPIDIAKRLNISTSILRHYEAWGLIPEVKRAHNGYRIYTEVHIAYFECIRAMLPGFGMDLIRYVFDKIDKKDIMSAILRINKESHLLYGERLSAEKTIEVLNNTNVDNKINKRKNKLMTIGEVANETNISTTAIRYWEKAALILPLRDTQNHYRLYDTTHFRRILLIHTLKKTIYSLDDIKTVVDKLDDSNVENLINIFKDSLKYFDEISKHQLKGCHAFYDLCTKLNLAH